MGVSSRDRLCNADRDFRGAFCFVVLVLPLNFSVWVRADYVAR